MHFYCNLFGCLLCGEGHFFSRLSLNTYVDYVPLKVPPSQIGMDEQGVFYCAGQHYYRLDFVRANAVQLIAKYKGKKHFLAYIWPDFIVIYRDSVDGESYRVLRSYAAQQMLLRRSEEASKRFK